MLCQLQEKETNLMSLVIKFYFTSSMLNMFRTLIHPSSGPCDFSIVVIQEKIRKVLMMDVRVLTLWPWSWIFTVQSTIYVKYEYFMNQEG